MAHQTIADFVERNRKLAEQHKPCAKLKDGKDKEMMETLIIACIDPRSDPVHIFGLGPGESGITRNAGGHVRIEEILFVEELVGGISNIMIIHHTDCGSTYQKDKDVVNVLKARYPKHQRGLGKLHFDISVDDLRQSVIDDVRKIKDSHWIRDELKANTQGFIYNLDTGLLEQVI